MHCLESPTKALEGRIQMGALHTYMKNDATQWQNMQHIMLPCEL